MKRAVLLSAVPVGPEMAAYLQPGDFIVACDAGYRNAAALGVRPDLIVGDFDSAPQPRTEGDTIVLPHVKDDTDTQYAARWLAEHGFEEVVMLGALGGPRVEHMLANLSTGLFLSLHGVRTILADSRSEMHYLLPGQPLELPRRDWMYLSLFALGAPLTGVFERGVYYPLENATLTELDYPLGTSNEFTEPVARLQCSGGHGLVVLTRADG
ncbi:MAG TPA: thiamine diphosphokinase [Candidatus Gemmiger avistercoris]|uniref:Thiamine diphosphokinase n=1 Tax=Candidatus Gemmiger avistercoris TaxID=2838606 RepID=A0A9D2FKB0_9FIRM|nr:thiamine diphosphokinase [uncultured Subdoligranulum sp.]HIZ62358.1 thiamine diphosphokinase [Candidatus Gemmiger avistercoris]